MLSPSPDEQLIAKALNGSQRSWVQLVKRYEGMVYNYCLRMSGQPNDALDLMQEVFLSVYRHLPSYHGQGQFKRWMMRIATNKSIDFLRAKARTPLATGSPGNMENPGNAGNTNTAASETTVHDSTTSLDWQAASSADNPDRRYEISTRNQAIMRTMSQLPLEQRMIVELKFFQHYTFEEISQQTGIPVNTVKSRLYSSLHKLRQQLEIKHVV